MASRPPIQETNTIREVVTNFSSEVLVTGNSLTNTNTGEVNIYNYDITQNTWSSPVTLSGPSTNSYFGSSIDINWDGTRIVIGANALARAYVYDYDGVSWSYNSNILQSVVGSDFGFSVSIAKDDANTIAVGAPQHNNVYVYEMLNDTNWTVSNVLNGSSIENIIGNNSTSNLILISDYNRYGESVKLSGYGDYIVIGQPGTILSNIFSSDATNFSVVDPGQKEVDGSVSIQPPPSQLGEYYNYFPHLLTRQEGSVQVFKTDSNWYLSNSQVGSTLYGERNCLITDNSRRGEGAWSPSGFGLNVDLSLDGGLITVAAPLFSINGGEYQYHNGNMYTYTYDDISNEWIRINSFLGSRQALLGLAFTLDYVGNRMAIVSRNHKQGSTLRVLDWNGIEWYDTKSQVNFSPQSGNFYFQKTTLSNGENVFYKNGDSVYTYKYNLTQTFEGNSLFSGYVSTPQLFVGTNDGDITEDTDTMPATSKLIAFGGTFGENTYNSTTIENRVYATFGNAGETGAYEHLAGRSELLIAKTFSDDYQKPAQIGDAVDYIRLKASEVHIDSHDYIKQTDDKYDMTPKFVMNYRGHIGIKIPEVEPVDKTFRSRTRTKADLDVNGSVNLRNKLTVNNYDRSEILNNDELQNIIWDTRNIDIVQSNKVYSNIFVNGFFSRPSTLSGSVTYSQENFAFLFTDSTGKIETDKKNVYIDNNPPEFNFWFKLTLAHNSTNYPGNYKIATIGTIGTNYGSVSLTPTGIEIDYNNRTCVLSNTITFSENTWYHVNARLAPDGSNPDQNNTFLYINDSQVTLSVFGSTTANYVLDGGNAHFTLGSGILNAYVGMITFNAYNSARLPSGTNWYAYGPPTEMLAVGGDATISGKLGVGLTNPTEALEVSGNVYINGEQSGFVVDASDLKRVGFMKYNGYGGALVHGSGQRLDFGRSDTTDVTKSGTFTPEMTIGSTGNVGIGTSNPQYTLDVSGDINFTGNLRKNGTLVSTGGLDPIVSLGPWIDDATELVLHHSDLDGFENYALRQDNSGGTHINADFSALFLEYGGTERMRVHSNGNVGVNNTGPVYTLDVGGTIRASGDVIAFSDGRYKTDVYRINDALNKINRVSGYTYRMKEGTERRAGVIAQEIREVLPEVVVGTEESGYNVAYGNMAGLFIEAIKELTTQVDELKAKVKELQAAAAARSPECTTPK